ncbi:MAG: HAMP domain-containing sensor histidine kinase [Pseudomonadota bacterium]
MALLMTVALIFVLFWILLSDGDALLHESEEAVAAELTGLAAIHKFAGYATLVQSIQARIRDDNSEFFYALRGIDGRLEAANIPGWPAEQVTQLGEGFVFFEFDHSFLPNRQGSRFIFSSEFDVIAKTHRFGSGAQLLVGRDIDDLMVAQFVASTLGWIVMGILLSIFILGYGVAYYVSTRFARIAATTDRIIATGNMSERLLVDGTWDDLSKLTSLLNRMLRELELRVDGIQSVSENIAHDLRTPLMRLRSRIEHGVEAGVRDELVGELDSVLDVFQSLLRISSIEAGKTAIPQEDVDLASLLEDAVELYEPIAEEKEQRLTSDMESVSTTGDRNLLFQVMVNLIDNATKFTPNGGAVHCSLAKEGDNAVLAVADSGPGIPPANHQKVFERFKRLDSSRGVPGNGLGLAFVAAVIHRHGGHIDVGRSSITGGAQFAISLPSAPPNS